MKNSILVLFALIVSISVMAQEEKVSQKETTIVKVQSEIQKDVKITEKNGEKILTITTTENGVTSEEIFKGEAAEKKLAEMEKEEAKDPAKREAAKKEAERKEKMVKESGTKNL